MSIRKRTEQFYDSETGKFYNFDNVSFYKDYEVSFGDKSVSEFSRQISKAVTRNDINYSFNIAADRRTISRLINFVVSSGKSTSIETIKQASYTLKRDPYAYLNEVASNSKKENCTMINKEFVKILNVIVDTHFYNYDSNGNACGKEYYCKQVDKISKQIYDLFWDDEYTRKVLLQLCDDLKVIISYSSMPGTPDYWEEINPKIRYFDPVYYFIENEPELYKEICANPSKKAIFRFIPSEKDIQKQREYFVKYNEMKNKNVDITEEKLYKNELLETLNLIFHQYLVK